MTQSRAPRRSQEEWLQLIMECRNSGMTDRTWCEQHGILGMNKSYVNCQCASVVGNDWGIFILVTAEN